MIVTNIEKLGLLYDIQKEIVKHLKLEVKNETKII